MLYLPAKKNKHFDDKSCADESSQVLNKGDKVRLIFTEESFL